MKMIQVRLTDSFLIGDVHSSPDMLRSLLNQVSTTDTCHYVFLGDLVDRGPDPNGVIDIVYEMWKNGKTTVLMGNHDWKFVRWYSGQTKVSMKDEQQRTLKQMTDESKKKFMHIFKDQNIGAWDPDMKIMLGHAAAGRPQRIFEKSAARLSSELKENFTVDDLMKTEAIDLSKNVGSRFLYGIVNGGETDENGFPRRMPITKSPSDDLDGWIFIHGHTHAKEFYPENGNPNIICLDWACGEEGGKLAGLKITSRDDAVPDKMTIVG